MRIAWIIAFIWLLPSLAWAKPVEMKPAPMPNVDHASCIDDETFQAVPCVKPQRNSGIIAPGGYVDGRGTWAPPDAPICLDKTFGVWRECTPTQLRDALKECGK